MGKLFGPDSPAVKFLWKAADIIALNLIWLVCCIPIVTIGPSTAAMYSVARRIARNEWPGVLKSFFKAFRENFKQALLVFLILLIPICMILLYLFVGSAGEISFPVWLKGMCWLGVLIIGFVWTYVFPLMAHFENTLGNTLKNAILLPLANPFLALVTTGLNLLPVLIMVIDFQLFASVSFFWLAAGCALTAVLNCKMLGRLFAQFEDTQE